MVNRKVDRIVLLKLASILGEMERPDSKSYEKVLKRRNVINSKLGKMADDKCKNKVIEKLENVINPFLSEKDLFKWKCGCMLTEEEDTALRKLCDCPIPNNYRNKPKNVSATNCKTNEEKIFKTIYKTSKDLNIHSRTISNCCEGRVGAKYGKSKNDGERYKFKYIN